MDKPAARHFNAANHSVSDIKVCAISLISGDNDSRKRHEKRLIFKIGIICMYMYMFIHLPIIHFAPGLLIEIANCLPIFAFYYAFVIVSLT